MSRDPMASIDVLISLVKKREDLINNGAVALQNQVLHKALSDVIWIIQKLQEMEFACSAERLQAIRSEVRNYWQNALPNLRRFKPEEAQELRYIRNAIEHAFRG